MTTPSKQPHVYLDDKTVKAIEKDMRAVHKDARIVGASAARSVFYQSIGAQVCMNCGATNAPDAIQCNNCNASHQVVLSFGGPVEPSEEPSTSIDLGTVVGVQELGSK